MYHVYILKDKNNKLYIGYSANLYRRMNEHRRKGVYTSKRIIDPRLYYYESYLTEGMAREREEKLKQYGSAYHGLLKRIGLR